MQGKLAAAVTLFALIATAPLLSACYTTAGAARTFRPLGMG